MSFSLMCGPAPRDDDDTWCDDCGNDRCQCDRGYAEYLAAWIAAVERGEFETANLFPQNSAEITTQEAA